MQAAIASSVCTARANLVAKPAQLQVCSCFRKWYNPDMNDHHQLKEIYWRSRRGMLELELKLVPFVRDCYPSLSPDMQAAYVALLAEEDWQIFDWIQGKETPEDDTMRNLVASISEHVGRL